MLSRLWHGGRLAALAAVAVVPMLTGSQAGGLVDTSPRTSAAVPRSGPAFGEGDPFPRPRFLPQGVEPQTTLFSTADRPREVRLTGPRGSRIWTASGLASHDLPHAAMRAYKRAAATTRLVDPSCQLSWTLLAGIGRVESDHGRYEGAVLSTDGVSRPPIIGVPLNGEGPVAAIGDTDEGKLDGDTTWDRAVGPMQFIPSTWAYAGRDGDGDGRRNPHDLDDAALGSAAYLCSGAGSMLDEASAKAAIFRYNPSDYYVALVRAFERGYRTGVFLIPSPAQPADEDGAGKKGRKHRDEDKAGVASTISSPTSKPEADDGPAPSPKPAPKPSASASPTAKPTPKPSPSPSPTSKASSSPPPTTQTLSGVVAVCGDGWCVGGKAVSFGDAEKLGATAQADFDGDGTAEPNVEELAGLAVKGATVTVTAVDGAVHNIGEQAY